MNKQQTVCDYIRESYLDFGRLRFDAVAQKVQIHALEAVAEVLHEDPVPVTHPKSCWRYITNTDINTIVCDCCRETGASVGVKEVLTMLNSDRIPRVHPLRAYIEELRPYDPATEPDWLADLAAQVQVIHHPDADTAEQQLWEQCFRKWFVGMVAAWLDDDIVNHQVLVLIGRQGIFKTTWLEHLIPPELRGYCCKMSNATQLTKDDKLRLAEFGLINLDELDAMTPRELSTMKSVITTADVNERAAYGYTKERRVRLASFCASSNRREFLTDLTGNRRWLPFEVENIASPFTHTLPYERIYAQAAFLARCGFFTYWFDLDDIRVLETHNADYRIQESEEQLLSILFDVPAEGRGEFFTTAQISERLVTYGNIKRPMTLPQLGTLLANAGYRGVTRGTKSNRIRGWIVHPRDTDQINLTKRLTPDEQRGRDESGNPTLPLMV